MIDCHVLSFGDINEVEMVSEYILQASNGTALNVP